jgi:drug/metabolite transporter (DMT)-like permease
MVASVGDSFTAGLHINWVFWGFLLMHTARQPALSGLLLAAAGAIAFSGKASIALGVGLLDEPLNVWIGLGTLLVLSGVYIVSKYGAK